MAGKRAGRMRWLIALALAVPLLVGGGKTLGTVVAMAGNKEVSAPTPLAGGAARPFLLGANYPYHAYGNDFGANAWGSYGVHDPATAAAVEADFARMAASGVTTVRWFLFADGRAGIVFDSAGVPIGLDDDVYRDLDAALAIAARHGIALDLVLLDFLFMRDATYERGVRLGGHAAVITSPVGRQAFLDTVLVPLLRRYGTATTIRSWEVMNEPEWALSDGSLDKQVSNPATFATFRAFVRQVADAVHQYSGSRVTLGSASARWVRSWMGLGLDYYQVHYYDWMRHNRSADLYALRAADLRLDRPVVVGEFPASGSTVADLTGYLDRWYGSGYAGAWFWSFAGVDRWGSADLTSLATWAQVHISRSAPPSPERPGLLP